MASACFIRNYRNYCFEISNYCNSRLKFAMSRERRTDVIFYGVRFKKAHRERMRVLSVNQYAVCFTITFFKFILTFAFSFILKPELLCWKLSELCGDQWTLWRTIIRFLRMCNLVKNLVVNTYWKSTRFGILELRNRVTKPSYAKWRHTSSYTRSRKIKSFTSSY